MPGLTLPVKFLPLTIGVVAMLVAGTTPAMADDSELGQVRARFETKSNFDDEQDGDADADDPAVWRHAVTPSDSVVVGTLKTGD